MSSSSLGSPRTEDILSRIIDSPMVDQLMPWSSMHENPFSSASCSFLAVAKSLSVAAPVVYRALDALNVPCNYMLPLQVSMGSPPSRMCAGILPSAKSFSSLAISAKLLAAWIAARILLFSSSV